MGEKRNPLKSCLIIGAAPCTSTKYIRTLDEHSDYTICADGGELIAQSCGISPDFWIGDGDSLNGDIKNEKRLVLPCEKAYTDMHCAVDFALEQGYELIYLCAASGGRMDHFLANLCLLEYVSDRGAIAVLADEQNVCFLHSGGNMVLNRPENYRYVSLLPIDEKLCGVTMTGLKYPLSDAVLERKIPIGVSNEPISDVFSIEISSGRALIVYSKDVSK